MDVILLEKAKKDWQELGYGMFLHFGPNTLEGKSWGDGTFPADRFEINGLDIAQWARTAADAGMKYAVLTTKHHDGFCLWPSKYTEYSVKNSPMKTDIVELFVKEFSKAGLKTGLYYSIWDRNCTFYDDDKAYAEYMQAQLEELLTDYGDILELWFDGTWDKDHPTRDWSYNPQWENDPNSGLILGDRWQWKEIYSLIHRLQPKCLVANNSSSDRPGGVKYMPIDIRTSEHFDFIYKEKSVKPILDPIYEYSGEKVFLPLEFCTSLNPDWFWKEHAMYSHPSVDAICGWYRTARESGANLLLNVGPSKYGKIPDYNAEYLRQAAKRLKLAD